MIIDTHVHYNLDPFYADWKKYWDESQAAGVGASIVIGVDADTNKKALEVVVNEPNLFCSVGFHPEEILRGDVSTLEPLLNDKVVAIGECGLDYFRLKGTPEEQEKEKRRQKTLFGQQIELARRHNLPLIIHCRDAYDDMLDTIHHFSMTDGTPPKAVLHCMSGPLSYLQEALKMGFYISFAGNVTYKSADALRELAKNTPLDRIFVETDAPFLAPQSHRGQTCEPRYITETVEVLASLYSIKVEEMARHTAENAIRFFNLPITA